MESKNRKMKPDSILHILFVFITTNPTVRVAPRAQIRWSENFKKNNYFGLLAECIFSLHEDIVNTLLLDLFKTSQRHRNFGIWKNGKF